ncbi:MAG: bifunctional class I SAM-dependent methyltransferase/glycosyltransferase family 2 protein [Thermodesulfobacteriota bacterium]
MSAKPAVSEGKDDDLFEILRIREEFRDRYWLKKDPIYQDRLLWRAQTFRHMVHLLPGQSILELGCGQGLFTRHLLQVSRGENPITAVNFNSHPQFAERSLTNVKFCKLSTLNDPISNSQFDHIIAIDLVDRRNCRWLLEKVYTMVKPGGHAVFYESNPRNLMLKLRNLFSQISRKGDPRQLLSGLELIKLFSKIGFKDSLLLYNDFVYPPLTSSLIWFLRNMSILLENTPGVRTFAGSILIHAQKPSLVAEKPHISLFQHRNLYKAVSVVIPCHNEEANIEPLTTKLKSYFGDYIYEIIPVDDNSTDSTREVIRRLASENPMIRPIFRSSPNGVGRAISDGLRAARGEYVLTLDCDFQEILPEIRDLFDAAAEGYDVVIGSRFSRHSVLLNYPLQKIIANRGFHLFAQILFLKGFRDLTNNLKLMRKEVAHKLQLTQPGFAVNAETGLQPLLMGYKVKEVPISWINRTREMGVSSFSLTKAAVGYSQVLIKLWFTRVFRIRDYP